MVKLHQRRIVGRRRGQVPVRSGRATQSAGDDPQTYGLNEADDRRASFTRRVPTNPSASVGIPSCGCASRRMC